MNRQLTFASPPYRWTLLILAFSLAAGATAQTLGAAEELRAAIQSELAPLQLTLAQQAKAVAAELAEEMLAGPSCRFAPGVPGQLASQRGEGASQDASQPRS